MGCPGCGCRGRPGSSPRVPADNGDVRERKAGTSVVFRRRRESDMPEDQKTTFIPIIEETASVTSRKVVTGRVRIATRTESIDRILPAHLSSQEVEVIRVPVDRRIETAPEIRTEGDVTIIPVVEERLVVTRELYLREEVHVRRVERTDSVEIPTTTRRQTVQIDRLPPPGEDADPVPSQNKDDQDDL